MEKIESTKHSVPEKEEKSETVVPDVPQPEVDKPQFLDRFLKKLGDVVDKIE